MLVVAGITAIATWLSAALPSEKTTHVNIWPPLGVFAVIAILGIYAIVAAERKRLWLPGRKAFKEGQERRFIEHAPDVWDDPNRHVTEAINKLTEAVNRLAPPDKKSEE
jgi:hypothetical protein